jgi:hypothetical protein
MSTVTVKGITEMQRAADARVVKLCTGFNKELHSFVKDWQTTANNRYAHRDGLAGIQKLFKVTELSRPKRSGGNTSQVTTKARIELTIKANKLSNFPYEQIRRTTQGRLLKARYDKSNKIVGRFKSYEQTYTVARVLRNTSMRVPVDKLVGTKGYLYKKGSRVNGKASTPTGIYVRSQKATWAGKQRLPTKQMYVQPMAVLINSPQTRNAFHWEKRVEQLGKALGR